MVGQGRLAKVMFSLMAAMTLGALVLLGLEGKPIRPMAFSLASQVRLSEVDTSLGTEGAIEPGRWRRIEISYRPSNGQVSSEYGLSGALAVGQHFVISNGNGAEDGQIFASHQWVKQRGCMSSDGGPPANRMIKICLIRDPGQPASTARQARRLEKLVESLSKHCRTQFQIAWAD